MRTITLFLTALIFVANVACTSDVPARAAVPAATPTSPPPPVPSPPPPIIADQTVVQLPAPQPIPPGSVPPRPPVEYHPPETAPLPTVTVAPTKKAARPPSTSQSAPKDASPKDASQKDASPKEGAPKDAAAKEGAPDQIPLPTEEPPAVAAPVTSAEDRTTSQGQIATILSEVRKLLSQAEAQPKTATTGPSIIRINSLVRLSEQASSNNEPRQAESLAKRALALVRDLVRAH
jgi:hypothetical protein